MAKKNTADSIMSVLNSKYTKWIGAITFLGISFRIGCVTQKSTMEREYQLLDEQRIKYNSEKMDELRNKIYDLRDENMILKQKINMYELKAKQDNGK